MAFQVMHVPSPDTLPVVARIVPGRPGMWGGMASSVSLVFLGNTSFVLGVRDASVGWMDGCGEGARVCRVTWFSER